MNGDIAAVFIFCKSFCKDNYLESVKLMEALLDLEISTKITIADKVIKLWKRLLE